MKILHIFPYSPIPPTFGGALRVYNLIKQMSKNHEVTLLTFGDEIVKDQLKKHFKNSIKEIYTCDIPWGLIRKRFLQLRSLTSKHSYFNLVAKHKQMQVLIDEITSKNNFDIIQFEFPNMANYRINSDSLKIIDAHNVEHIIFYHQWKYSKSIIRKIFYKLEYKKLQKDEVNLCQNQDALFVTSDNDVKLFNELVPQIPKYVIPNGVDTEYYHPYNQEPEPNTLVFTGTLSYIPNSDAALYFIDNILPIIKKQIPDVKLYIVGNRPPKSLIQKSSSDIIITGYVNDVRPYVWKSSIFIVPLRMGSGTRLKVLEAFAMKKPVVSTTIGAEGIETTNGENILIADEPKNFAENIIRLLRDKQLQQNLATSGYELVKNKYDWNIIGQKLDDAYNEIYSRDNSSRKIKNISLQNERA